MNPLKPPHSHHLSAAEGWVELGNLAEARAELSLVGKRLLNHPEVLSVRWSISAGEKNWPEALELSQQLMKVSPESLSAWLHQAYALRRVPEGGLQAAWDALLPALKLFPGVDLIPYNLACYACQLGRLDQARALLKAALKIGTDHIKRLALEDTDLKPLWPELREA